MESLLPQCQRPDVLSHLNYKHFNYQHLKLKYVPIHTALVYEVQKFFSHSLGLTIVSLTIFRLLFRELFSIHYQDKKLLHLSCQNFMASRAHLL